MVTAASAVRAAESEHAVFHTASVAPFNTTPLAASICEFFLCAAPAAALPLNEQRQLLSGAPGRICRLRRHLAEPPDKIKQVDIYRECSSFCCPPRPPPAIRRRTTLRRDGCSDADRYRCHLLNDSGTYDRVAQERALSRELLLGPASYRWCWRRLRDSARLHRRVACNRRYARPAHTHCTGRARVPAPHRDGHSRAARRITRSRRHELHPSRRRTLHCL